MSGFYSPLLIGSSSAIVLTVQKVVYNGRLKREKSPTLMYPLYGVDLVGYQCVVRSICYSQYQFSCLYIA